MASFAFTDENADIVTIAKQMRRVFDKIGPWAEMMEFGSQLCVVQVCVGFGNPKRERGTCSRNCPSLTLRVTKNDEESCCWSRLTNEAESLDDFRYGWLAA